MLTFLVDYNIFVHISSLRYV